MINFNNGLKYAVDYSSRIYGKDVSIYGHAHHQIAAVQNIFHSRLDLQIAPLALIAANMPMIGAVYEDYAVLAIVENGEGMAEINVQVAGKMDDYNKAFKIASVSLKVVRSMTP